METALDLVETTADAVAELAVGAVVLAEDAIGTSDESRRLGRSLFKLLIVALVVAAIVGAVTKMRGNDQPAASEPS